MPGKRRGDAGGNPGTQQPGDHHAAESVGREAGHARQPARLRETALEALDGRGDGSEAEQGCFGSIVARREHPERRGVHGEPSESRLARALVPAERELGARHVEVGVNQTHDLPDASAGAGQEMQREAPVVGGHPREDRADVRGRGRTMVAAVLRALDPQLRHSDRGRSREEPLADGPVHRDADHAQLEFEGARREARRGTRGGVAAEIQALDLLAGGQVPKVRRHAPVGHLRGRGEVVSLREGVEPAVEEYSNDERHRGVGPRRARGASPRRPRRRAGVGRSGRGCGQYEEYHPYGTTAWQAPELTTVSLKRYKFTGMERDEETGLQRHGVRYYAAWLGRWTSADPIGLGDGGNRYSYVRGSPLGNQDTSGLLAGLDLGVALYRLAASAGYVPAIPEPVELWLDDGGDTVRWGPKPVSPAPSAPAAKARQEESICRASPAPAVRSAPRPRPKVGAWDGSTIGPAPGPSDAGTGQISDGLFAVAWSARAGVRYAVADEEFYMPDEATAALGNQAFGAISVTAQAWIAKGSVAHALPAPTRWTPRVGLELPRPTLNLGSGNNPMAGAVNVDLVDQTGVDVVADARALPFANFSFSEAHSVNPYGFNPVSAETARVLRPGALLMVTGTARNGWAQPLSSGDARAAGFELLETAPMVEAHNFGQQLKSTGEPLNTTTSTTTTYRRL